MKIFEKILEKILENRWLKQFDTILLNTNAGNKAK